MPEKQSPTSDVHTAKPHYLLLVLFLIAGFAATLITLRTAATALSLAGIANPGEFTTYGIGIATIIFQGGAAIAVGGAVFAAFFVPPQKDRTLDLGGYQALRLGSVGAGSAAVAAVMMVPFEASLASGKTFTEVLDYPVLTTAIGAVSNCQMWLWTAGLAMIAAILLRTSWKWNGAVSAVPISFSLLIPGAITGHAAGGGAHDMATNSLLLHVCGAALWLGGLVMVLLYLRQNGKYAALALTRFSRVAFWAFIIVAASGVLNALTRINVSQLFSETYGQIILLKVLGLLALLAFGVVQRKLVITQIVKKGLVTTRTFVRLALSELGVFAFTVGVAVGLSRAAPPNNFDLSLSAFAQSQLVQLGFVLPQSPSIGRIFTQWRFDLLFGTAAIVFAIVYLVAVIKLRRRGDAWPWGRVVAFLAGAALLLLATSSGLGKYGPAMFSMHMITHMTLAMLAPLLFVLGAPVTLALRVLPAAAKDLPPGLREWILLGLHSKLSRFITQPLLVVVMFVGSFYVLYFGGLFDIAVKYHAAHILMNIHFLISGYLFYWIVVGIDPAPRTLSPVAKIGVVFGSIPFHAFFGVALMQTGTVIAHDFYSGLNLEWQQNLLTDQNVGGGIAWASGEIPLVLVMVALFLQWNRHDTRLARRVDRQADRDGDADLESYNAMLTQLNKRLPK